MKEHVQNLESRQLLSADLTAGVLTITGTAKNDDIVVSLNSAGDTITVKERASSRFKRGSVTTTTFDAVDVTSIVVNAGAGNDSVTLKGTRSTALEIAASLVGGDGNDRLSAAGGADTVDGGAGDDDLFGGAGNDLLNGGAGDDLIRGGDGTDSLNGDDGDDLLIATDDETTDIVDGGLDSSADGEDDGDLAIVDDGEDILNATAYTPEDLPWPFFGGFGHGHGGARGHGGGSSNASGFF